MALHLQCTSPTSAKEAWAKRFHGQHIELQSGDSDPFVLGRELGHGGNGHVYEIHLGGIPVALKKNTRQRKLGPELKRELEILKHLSKGHKHIVKLIGSYMFKQRRKGGYYELGVVIWPVAPIDLAELMQELDILRQSIHEQQLPEPDLEELRSSIQKLATVMELDSKTGIGALYDASLKRLCSTFACISEAVLWLHEMVHVRHSDLKPSQVLLSRTGVWLTDFGTSKQIEDLDHTATTGVDSVTMKYQAPERALAEPRGRAEDVFALGCIYLEMAWVLYGLPIGNIKSMENDGQTTAKDVNWSYSRNVERHRGAWTAAFADSNGRRAAHLAALIELMLSLNPSERPRVREVLGYLSVPLTDGLSFFSACCASKEPEILHSPTELGQADDHQQQGYAVTNTPPEYDSEIQPDGLHHRYDDRELSSAASQGRGTVLASTHLYAQPAYGRYVTSNDFSHSNNGRLETMPFLTTNNILRYNEPEAVMRPAHSLMDYRPASRQPWADHSGVAASSHQSWSTYPILDAPLAWPPPHLVHKSGSSQDDPVVPEYVQMLRTSDLSHLDSLNASWNANLPSDSVTDDFTDALWLDTSSSQYLEEDPSANQEQTIPWDLPDTDSGPYSSCTVCKEKSHGGSQKTALRDHFKLMHSEPLELLNNQEDGPSSFENYGSERSESPFNGELLGCPTCSKTFSGRYNRANLARHIRQKHGQRYRANYPCEAESCTQTFKRSDACLKHYRKHHSHLIESMPVFKP